MITSHTFLPPVVTYGHDFSALLARAGQAFDSFMTSPDGMIFLLFMLLVSVMSFFVLGCHALEKTREEADEAISLLVDKIARCQTDSIGLAQEQFAQVLTSLNEAEAARINNSFAALRSAQTGLRQLEHVYRFFEQAKPETR